MINRREFGIAGMSVMAAVTMSQSSLAQPNQGGSHSERDQMLEMCSKACSDCERLCNSCSTHCAHELHAGHKDHMASLMTCQDCAAICGTAAQVTARGGPFAALICDACAEACSRCAKECEKFKDDKHMKACAEECRKCEKACRDMVKHVASAK